MLPMDLEKKIKAVLEWNIAQKGKKPEDTVETGRRRRGKKWAVREPGEQEEDYLDKLFAKFTIKPEELPETQDLKEESPISSIIPGLNEAAKISFPSSEPKPRPRVEEFPETLFS
ncbi:hypothetical protein KP509_20G008500 [Ceratopteris richardii]|nr:hypothetical protein KP509_20G008500 [Ceratopteris richardii]